MMATTKARPTAVQRREANRSRTADASRLRIDELLAEAHVAVVTREGLESKVEYLNKVLWEAHEEINQLHAEGRRVTRALRGLNSAAEWLEQCLREGNELPASAAFMALGEDRQHAEDVLEDLKYPGWWRQADQVAGVAPEEDS